MAYIQGFNEAVKRYLVDKDSLDPDDTIVRVWQELETGGVCDTCAWEEIYVFYTYQKPSGEMATSY